VKTRPTPQEAAGSSVRSAHPQIAEEVQLIERIKNGETEAYAELVEKYQDRLFNTCWRISGHLEDARDLTQETFLRAYEKLSTFRDQSSFYTWIYRVAVNLALSHRRTMRRRRVVSGDFGDADATGTQAERLVERAATADDKGPEKAASDVELQKAIAHALQALDDEHRAVVVLRDIEDFNYAEISEILEIPPGTVKSRLHRARMALRSAILPALRGEDTGA